MNASACIARATGSIILTGLLAGAPQDPHETLRASLQQIAARQLGARKAQIAAIQTREQVEARKGYVRSTLLRMIGGLPAERTPLNLRRSGRLDRGDYRVEKIVYESLPNFYVTANLYVPQKGNPPYPAVLQPTGHSLAAKSRAFYQNLALGLVKHGFVVLTYDPLGQGERGIFYDRDLEDSKVGGTTVEHQMVGIQSLLAGESIARYMIWDGMRSLDVLQSLSEVDPKRLGVAGCSGGGTLTAYLAALDDRVQAAAPACYITDWEDQLQGTGPQDAEQQFPDQLRDGLNHADLILAFAPKPYLICSTTDDFFPLAGARKALEESKRIYAILGQPEKVSWSTAPGPHGTPKLIREAIYGWMNRWLKGAADSLSSEPEFETEYEQDLYCTPTGQVSTSLGGETASTLNIRRFAKLAPPRRRFSGNADVESLKSRIQSEILRLTRYEPPTGTLETQENGEDRRDGYRITRLAYSTGEGRYVPAMLAIPDPIQARKKTILYVSERGAAADAGSGGEVDQLARLGYTVLAIDAAGLADTRARRPGYSAPWFGEDKTTWLALMVGKPLVGLRMEDIRRGVDLLAQKGLLHGGACGGFAKGFTGVDLLHAAVLDPRIAELTIEGNLISYEAIARAPIHRRIFEAVLPGVLGKYDLPDLVAALSPRPVRLVDVRSPLRNTIPLAEARKTYQYALESYAAAGAPSGLRIGLRREGETLASSYPELR